MAKRIAVLVRERQTEALRVAVGLTLRDDRVEVYILDRAVEPTPENRGYLDTLAELGMPVGTNAPGGAGLAFVPTDEIARRLLACDHVVVY